MEASKFAQPHILSQPVYVPGKPITHVAREFGIDPASIDKLASNENPLGPSPMAVEAATRALREVNLYPDGSSFELTEKVAGLLNFDPNQIVFGNGSNELLELVAHVFLGPGTEAVFGEHGFAVYKLVTLLMGATPVAVPMPQFRNDLEAFRAAITPRTRVVFLASPNNPTGPDNTEKEIFDFVRSLPEHVLFVLDEAYADYLDKAPDLRPLIQEGRAVLCARTFSKIYGLAGLRAGYAYTRQDIASLIQRVRAPFNLNLVAQAAAFAALDDLAFVKRSRSTNRAGLAQLSAGFKDLKLDVVPSRANFLMAKVPSAKEAFKFLQSQGSIVRPVGTLPDYLRFTVGLPEQNDRLLSRLRNFLENL
ncbi:MAG TPA: histidinol-phosphate transaminase [Fibrobacteraceae bacterium]|nr:histidinol-phosphate transaminase [Fibrobacteraceae bacterium]